ncbi:DUF480 domain-containing protein [Lapillicoccus jejuensis]|uniref:Methyltransferase domain-containing protein n=1 Tax=Lapillicoccus jejuensis TaxID=402171 RepID=A0A542E057_9MICO|nr:DUF480 domain-containing protein [Lapillicoccus jejuensis]TQJ08737.1 hypothetical protein FB458_1829 [Lapillicoccus jejuensis]
MPDELPVLDAVDQRVLGSLLEKQRTVPASYPLSVNALRTACNQSSSREPVVDYDESTVERAARSLKDRGLVRVVWAGAGQRTLKFHQTLDEVLELADDERALLTVLLLRGAQAPGELRTRTERLHPFADREAVEAVLQRLAARSLPLVAQLERRPGQQDHRWVHLLGPVDTGPAAGAAGAPVVDRESVLRDGPDARDRRVLASIAAVATPYAETFGDEIRRLPFERWLLDRVAVEVDEAPVVEVGCGPGQVTAWLAESGVAAQGVDLSPEMVAEARRLHPGLTFEVGDLRRLMRPAGAHGWGAVLAWYSLIYLAESELASAVAAVARPLAPGGLLVLAMHAGAGIKHADEWLEQEVDLDVVLHDPAAVRAAVAAAGLVDVEWYLRGPIAERGETTDRLYVLGRAPA